MDTSQWYGTVKYLGSRSGYRDLVIDMSSLDAQGNIVFRAILDEWLLSTDRFGDWFPPDVHHYKGRFSSGVITATPDGYEVFELKASVSPDEPVTSGISVSFISPRCSRYNAQNDQDRPLRESSKSLLRILEMLKRNGANAASEAIEEPSRIIASRLSLPDSGYHFGYGTLHGVSVQDPDNS